MNVHGDRCQFEGFIYVTSWKPYEWIDAEKFPPFIKVGMSTQPDTRIYNLSLQYSGFDLVDRWISHPHLDQRWTEDRVLSWLQSNYPIRTWDRYRPFFVETFTNIPAADAIAFAQTLPMESHAARLVRRRAVRRGTVAWCGCRAPTLRELKARAAATAA